MPAAITPRTAKIEQPGSGLCPQGCQHLEVDRVVLLHPGKVPRHQVPKRTVARSVGGETLPITLLVEIFILRARRRRSAKQQIAPLAPPQRRHEIFSGNASGLSGATRGTKKTSLVGHFRKTGDKILELGSHRRIFDQRPGICGNEQGTKCARAALISRFPSFGGRKGRCASSPPRCFRRR